MLHRALFGSIERFIGILIEHYAGVFPLWLAPVQMVIIPVNNDAHLAYANEVMKCLKKNSIRVSIDERDEKMNYKIRESQTKKIPYTLVIGNEEMENQLVTYRTHGSNKSVTVKLVDFIEMAKVEMATFSKKRIGE